MDERALAELIERAQRGDPASFERLVDEFAGRVYGFALRTTGSRDDAEDLMQEVFVRVVRMIGAYQHDGRFKAWLFRIAANLVRDRLRRIRRAPRVVAGSDVLEDGGADQAVSTGAGNAPIDDQAPEHGLIRADEVDALNRALAMLPDAEREVVMLRHFSQLPFKEIAAVLGCPLGTALARAHRGLAHLREIMAGRE
jgi:RNA polymerase sigma-70 factor (ECF subfamily)